MATRKIKFTVNAFFGDNELELPFPDNWAMVECRMAGHGRPALTPDQIRERLANPIGSPRLRDMARGKQKVCILFDDMPKPTRADRIVPYVLEELKAGGIQDDQIRFICAPGTHRPLTYAEFAAKLGASVVEKYLVFNHTVWENLVFKGNTSRGTPVWVNREFDSCDLRLAVGSIFPHGSAGFGGGGKIILPGVAGMDTVDFHHKNMTENAGLARVDDNVFRLDLEETARMAGLHFKVDCVLNEKREASGLFCGDFVQEHREGVKMARQMYTTPVATNADIVVTNAYPDEPQMGRSHWVVPVSLKEGGDVVVLTHSPDGQNLHQFSSRFGTDYGGRNYKPSGGRYPRLAKAGRVLLLAPFMSKYDLEDAGPAEKVIWCKEWSEVLAELVSKHGAGTKVAVYPYAPLQIPAGIECPTPEYAVGAANCVATVSARDLEPAPAS